MGYLKLIENINLINNISKDGNNNPYYNFVIESGMGMPIPDSTNILTDDYKRINVLNLNIETISKLLKITITLLYCSKTQIIFFFNCLRSSNLNEF